VTLLLVVLVVPAAAWAADPAPPAGLRVLHRAGQTFIIFPEAERLVTKERITWGELKPLLAPLDKPGPTRYQVFRHSAPITAANVDSAQRIAEVKPLSAYNVRGRSVDECIAAVRRRAIDDLELATKLARSGYFGRFNPDAPEMDEVTVERFAVEDDKPLPLGVGLYVHSPRKAGKAYYAVVATASGRRVRNAFHALQAPVAEAVGRGEPVRQGEADVTVFYDYPGKRYRYVQWAAPPLTHQASEYYNWGVFVPAGYAAAKTKRLSVFFHDSRQRYLKPPWPHRPDTVLLSPHDAPYASFGYGYNDALGTGKPLEGGTVRPFFALRVDAVLDWAVREFGADPGRVSVGGRGYWGGTAALQYGIRRPGRIAYAMAEGGPDANPRQMPYEYKVYLWRASERPRPTRRKEIDAVWGKPEWSLKCESGRSIWDQMDLPAYVRAAKAPLPYLSLGAGSMSSTWQQQTELMLAYKQSRNAFMSQFYWGGSGHVPVPRDGFEPRSDRPLLATWPLQYSPNAAFMDKHFFTGLRGYSSGCRLNNRVRWESETIVDTAGRLEMTIYSDRTVSYAGTSVCETTVRNARQFKPAAGKKLTWTLTAVQGGRRLAGGEITVGKDGRIVIPELAFGQPARLLIRRASE
jgi:hypothetical protein